MRVRVVWLRGRMATEMFRELAAYSSPKCHAHLVLVSYPTGDEVRRAAEAGNAEALRMLQRVLESERRVEQWEREALREPSQLPDVSGDSIAFVWEVTVDDGDAYYVITAGERLVWRERARWEDWKRFNEVKALFKEKYGARFVSLTPTDAASLNLMGDKISVTLEPI
jgi:hypothetical protein